MKTSKQLSEQVFEKISKYENMRLQFRKKVRKTFAVCIMLGFLLPTAVYFSITEQLNHDQPLSFPFTEEIPFDPDETPQDIPENDLSGGVIATL